MGEFDVMALFEAQAVQQRDAARMEERYGKLTRKLFCSAAGKEWLGLAMARMNFMGSVFDEGDGMNAVRAAHRDGMRAVISDILNCGESGESAG